MNGALGFGVGRKFRSTGFQCEETYKGNFCTEDGQKVKKLAYRDLAKFFMMLQMTQNEHSFYFQLKRSTGAGRD